MNAVNLHLMGRFGNNLFQYVFARAYCEKYGHELHCPEWVGEKVFRLPKHPRPTRYFPLCNEDSATGQGDITLYGYFQNQKSIDLYTRTKARKWLEFNLGWVEMCCPIQTNVVACHLRRGDYFTSGYPVVSEKSYDKFLNEHSHGGMEVIRVSDDRPRESPHGLPPELSFLPDFLQLNLASVLLRANSSFSYWAAVLTADSQRVFSPRIDGLEGGKEHDNVRFEEGNHCRLADLPFVTDLHLKP